MNTIQKLTGLSALFCLAAAGAHAAGHSYSLPCVASGNWNSANVRTANSYLIGFNAQHPDESGAYFEFNLTPAQGKTITAATCLIIGSSDYDITCYWPNPDNQYAPDHTQFKVGICPQNAGGHPFTVAQITTGNNIANLYHYTCDANQNADLGYTWTPNGLHPGQLFDCFHYESTGQVGPALQNAVNAGGDYVLFACDRYDLLENGQECTVNYIWGSTSFTTANVLNLTTSN
jgi:hypothetical protein